MKTCVIFCAAGFDKLVEDIDRGDLVIAADGGLRHVKALGLSPDAVLGDFDSLGYVPENGAVYPVEKDDTDAMLAVRRGLEQGFRRFVIYGGLDGARLDHTIANFQMLHHLAKQGAEGFLVGKDYLAAVICGGSIRFSGDARGIVSVFCLGEDARGVNIAGLKYELTDGTLSSSCPLGVSNQFIGIDSEISVENGSLLILWDRENGLPKR